MPRNDSIPAELAQIINTHRALFGGFQMMADAGTQDGNTAGDTSTGDDQDQSQGPRTFTQEELNKLIADRVGRERAKYADYGDMKRKAAELDQIEEAQKTEAQKQAERNAEADRKSAEADRKLAIADVAGKLSVPAAILSGPTANTPEAIEAFAQAVLAFAGERKKQGNYVPNEGRNKAPIQGGEGAQTLSFINRALGKE